MQEHVRSSLFTHWVWFHHFSLPPHQELIGPSQSHHELPPKHTSQKQFRIMQKSAKKKKTLKCWAKSAESTFLHGTELPELTPIELEPLNLSGPAPQMKFQKWCHRKDKIFNRFNNNTYYNNNNNRFWFEFECLTNIFYTYIKSFRFFSEDKQHVWSEEMDGIEFEVTTIAKESTIYLGLSYLSPHKIRIWLKIPHRQQRSRLPSSAWGTFVGKLLSVMASWSSQWEA